MYKLDLPKDLAMAATLELRRNREIERQNRIFNSKVRIIGVSIINRIKLTSRQTILIKVVNQFKTLRICICILTTFFVVCFVQSRQIALKIAHSLYISLNISLFVFFPNGNNTIQYFIQYQVHCDIKYVSSQFFYLYE